MILKLADVKENMNQTVTQNQHSYDSSNRVSFLEGAYAGVSNLLFGYLAGYPYLEYRTAFTWLYVVLTVGIFAAICVTVFQIRDEQPWRWVKSLTYCLLSAAAMAVSNTGLIRFLVFVLAVTVYPWTIKRLERKGGFMRSTS